MQIVYYELLAKHAKAHQLWYTQYNANMSSHCYCLCFASLRIDSTILMLTIRNRVEGKKDSCRSNILLKNSFPMPNNSNGSERATVLFPQRSSNRFKFLNLLRTCKSPSKKEKRLIKCVITMMNARKCPIWSKENRADRVKRLFRFTLPIQWTYHY